MSAKKKSGQRVFLDYASITPVSPEVQREMNRVEKFWANPSSLYREGEEAKNILEEARVKIARILHCRANEIHFTSGGTESLNIAVLGIINSSIEKFKGKLPHIIISSIEHPAVLEPVKKLIKEGKAEAAFVLPNEKGLINPRTIEKEIKESTVLIAIQHANNEIGTVQPVRKISEAIENSKSGAVLLVDASQSALYEDVSIERLGADVLILDGMKLYGPRGTGVLAVKRGVDLNPVYSGGGQEGGLRPGTQNLPGAVGMAKALEVAAKTREKESKRLKELRDFTVSKILKEIPGSSLNGDSEKRLPNNMNICFPGADSEFLVIKLDTMGFAVSAASACHALTLENSSYVIESVSGKDCASSSLRITLGRGTKKSDLDRLAGALKKIIK